ncbi:hypothetical protein, partial [Corynebacterium sp.]|uniref:hypothetical protein n=1 Tax=Corynebacterium sp. TaxID=1720 RepID=UPI0025C43310
VMPISAKAEVMTFKSAVYKQKPGLCDGAGTLVARWERRKAAHTPGGYVGDAKKALRHTPYGYNVGHVSNTRAVDWRPSTT